MKNQTFNTFPGNLRNGVLKSIAVTSILAAASLAGVAQAGASKTVVVEPTGAAPVANTAPAANTNIFIVFGQWLERLGRPAVPPVLTEPIAPIAWSVVGNATPTAYEPTPVILGQPELPLVGQAAAEALQQWSTGLNYQGVQISYLVADASGKRQEVRSVARGVAAGEKFKIRYTASFEAAASIDRLVGDAWTSQRVGQVWPQSGMSVQSNAGETVELPLGGGFFVMGANPQERFVLTVRHPNAKGISKTNQPVYRQDGVTGSSYLQLVPNGKLAAVEQVIAARGAK